MRIRDDKSTSALSIGLPANIGGNTFTLSNRFAVPFLTAVTLLVYWPVFSLKFQTAWDDQWVAINSYTESGINWNNFLSILTEFYNGQFAPVNQLYYTILYSLVGYDPFWFHTAGLLVHIINVLLLYFFVIRLLRSTTSFESLSVQRIAFFTALLMAVHPFLVEAVAWISASKVILHAMFYLIAMHFYLIYLKKPNIANYLFVVFFFILSFGGKEQAVTFPVCLLLLDYVLKRNFSVQQLWLEKVPFFILSLSFGVIAMLAQAESGEGILSIEQSYPFYQNMIFASYSLCEYLIKCLIPVKLSYLYPFPNSIGEAVPLKFWIYPFAVLFITTSLWSFWKKRWIFFGLGFFIIHIAIVLHIIPLSRFAIIADRYVYLASTGIFFILAYFLDLAIIQKIKYRKLIIFLSAIYILALGIYAHERTKVWHDTNTLKKELRQLLRQRNDFEQNVNKIFH